MKNVVLKLVVVPLSPGPIAGGGLIPKPKEM